METIGGNDRGMLEAEFQRHSESIYVDNVLQDNDIEETNAGENVPLFRELSVHHNVTAKEKGLGELE